MVGKKRIPGQIILHSAGLLKPLYFRKQGWAARIPTDKAYKPLSYKQLLPVKQVACKGLLFPVNSTPVGVAGNPMALRGRKLL